MDGSSSPSEAFFVTNIDTEYGFGNILIYLS
jgi:hypothetical protein